MKKRMNNKGQGTTEYVLILGVIVAIAVSLLWSKLKPALDSQVGNIVSSIQQPHG